MCFSSHAHQGKSACGDQRFVKAHGVKPEEIFRRTGAAQCLQVSVGTLYNPEQK